MLHSDPKRSTIKKLCIKRPLLNSSFKHKQHGCYGRFGIFHVADVVQIETSKNNQNTVFFFRSLLHKNSSLYFEHFLSARIDVTKRFKIASF